MSIEKHSIVVVGAGQAGLALSHHLRQRNLNHLVLERRRIAERWRTDRWDSLAFQMPNWALELPGKTYEGADPDGFARHPDILKFIEDYAAEIEVPVRERTEVTALRRNAATGDYILETSGGVIAARQVVIATGPFHDVRTPDFASSLPADIFQTDAVRYKSPERLPEGGVLVVGSGSSGTQIADELLDHGRKVYLSVGRHRFTPRRYRGKDVIWWLEKLGRFDVPIDQFPDRKYPPPTVMTGVDGGYDLWPRLLADKGAILLGRVLGCSGGTLAIADDLNRVLAAADQSCRDFLTAADALADSLGLDLAADPWLPAPSSDLPEIASLRLAEAEITTILWATGYRYDYAWVDLPVFDAHGLPEQRRGVTDCPGVYFLGLHWMHNFRSGILSYVGLDASHLADCIATFKAPSRRSGRRTPELRHFGA